MAETEPGTRPDQTVAGDHSSRAGDAEAEAFPPLTISLETFVKNGSDREFRELVFCLIALHNQMQLHMDHFARHIGTTNAQFHVIMALAQTPNLTVSQIAQLMNVTSQFVTIEIGGLVRKGIVERRPNENDRRTSFLNLTVKGRSMVRMVAPLLRRANDLHFGALSAEQARGLRESLDAVVAAGRGVIRELESPDASARVAPSARTKT